MATPSKEKTILTSLWDGLNEHLIARFYEVDRKMNPIGNVEVWAPLTEANLEMTLSWNSPFENSGPESKAPVLLAMLNSGAFKPVIDAIFGNSKNVDASEISKKSSEFVKQFEGRTGITKLNSTQVFTGMPPVSIPVTALFRAWRDPEKEVENPIDQLTNWALPEELSPDGTIVSRVINAASGNAGVLDVLLPSKSPTMIAMLYKGRTYGPLVIESIAKPLSGPVYRDGINNAELQVTMVLCSISAIDRSDWKAWKTGGGQ
jgi:hypothetical protein